MMTIATIKEFRDIPLSDLEIGLGQVRVRNVSKDIAELASSIRRVGLLEPIVVAESDQNPGKYQILTGQRRFQAVQSLGHETIKSVVLDRAVDELEAKVISLTENVVRSDLGRPDLVDAFTYLYYKYGTIKAVAEATGISVAKVSDYVKFDRLLPELKDAVRKGEVELDAAIKAQDAATAGRDKPDPEEALKFAREMQPMTKYQRDRLRKTRVDNPDADAADVIEEAKTTASVTQIIVGISSGAHKALRSYADREGVNQSDAAADLIESGLEQAGLLGE